MENIEKETVVEVAEPEKITSANVPTEEPEYGTEDLESMEASNEAGEDLQEEEEDSQEPEKQPAEKPAADTVPLSKYLGEKKRRQELEKVFAQQTAEREKLALKDDLIKRGWPEYEAELQAADKVRQKQESDEVKSKLIDFEIKDLSKSDPFFADAETFKDEIKGKMREMDVDAETAYMLIRGRTRTREYQLQQEQRELVKRKSPSATKKVANAAPEPPKSPYKLDDHDKKALAELQRVQPDSGWTPEKYYKMMKT